MINWYNDSTISILFDKQPDIKVQFPMPNETKKEKTIVCSKPFINRQDLKTVIIDRINLETFEFLIPKDYCWDGASIPRLFWRLIGAKEDSRFLIPSLIHDYLCENHELINNDRYLSTIVFERLLYVSGVASFKRWMMKHAVDNYQKFCGWGK